MDQSADVLDLSGRQLQLFLAIFDHRNLTDASRALNIDPANAGKMLELLRQVLDADLFIRTGRVFEPTEFAIHIEPGIRENLARLESLAAPRIFQPSDDYRRITVAANVTELLDEVIQIRDSIKKDAPNCTLRFLKLGSRDNIEPMLSSGEADIVITVSATEYAGSLSGCVFSVDRHVVFFDPACRPPVHIIEDFAEAEHATLDFGRAGKSTINRILEGQSLSRRVTLSAPDVAALGTLITGTRLISTMQSRLPRSTLSHLAYCEPPLYLPSQKFDLVWHRRSDNSAKSKWLRNLIMSVAEANQFARD